jgi:putative RNA 2'-phosphotransferase
MDTALLKRVSKHMALILRHAPERAGLVLDPEGYVHLDDLVAALRGEIAELDADTVRAVVAVVEPHKQRYAIEGEFVRANYGHSTAERIAHEPAEPPAELFHGTTDEALDTIRRQGLRPMRRQYVHLTTDRALALSVGARHGASRLLRIDAAAAHAAGLPFYKANHTFWLVAAMPPEFLEPI